MLRFLKDEVKIHGALVTKVSFADYSPSSAIELDVDKNVILFCFEHSESRPGAQLDAMMQSALIMMDGLLRRHYSEQMMQSRNKLQEAISYYEIAKSIKRRSEWYAKNRGERQTGTGRDE